jgi:Fe2+ or Zn2+ uptake regulation protein
MEIDLPNEVVDLATKFSKFKVESIELTLRGLCPECTGD